MGYSVAPMRKTLSAARKDRSLSVEQLAERSGVGRATLYRLESGETPDPAWSTVCALEDALGLKRGTLVFGQEAEALAS